MVFYVSCSRDLNASIIGNGASIIMIDLLFDFVYSILFFIDFELLSIFLLSKAPFHHWNWSQIEAFNQPAVFGNLLLFIIPSFLYLSRVSGFYSVYWVVIKLFFPQLRLIDFTDCIFLKFHSDRQFPVR